MDFYTVLDQVVDLLRRRRRVTYGALRLQFGLTEEQIAVLKDELIDAQGVARDEDGRMLVWTGAQEDAPASTAGAARAPERGNDREAQVAPIAHEDHAQRALYAALRMQEDLARYAERLRREQGRTLELRVGLNTGEVVVRSIRTDDLHTDYVPVGHSTGLAARLQSLAPGAHKGRFFPRRLHETPSPRRGGRGGWGGNPGPTPHLNPPPQGGRSLQRLVFAHHFLNLAPMPLKGEEMDWTCAGEKNLPL